MNQSIFGSSDDSTTDGDRFFDMIINTLFLFKDISFSSIFHCLSDTDHKDKCAEKSFGLN